MSITKLYGIAVVLAAITGAVFGQSQTKIDPLPILQRLAGGEWIFENKKDDGTVFRGRSVTEKGPDGKSLISRGWLGDAGGMFFHHAGQVYRDPETKSVRFQSLDENGALATGEITAASDQALVWDWNMIAMDGRKAHYRVDMSFKDADHYEFVLHEIKADGSAAERVRVQYARVAEAPEGYRKLKSQKS